MPTVFQAIRHHLNAIKATHNGPDLLEHWSEDMETQVNVSPGKGIPVEGKRSTYSDPTGIDEWHHIRVPKNANTIPEFRDYELRFMLEEHYEGIGCTGWNWKKRVSRRVGFDFDSITGHAPGIGVSDDDLEKVKEKASALPYVEARRSTGGNGLHLYVTLDDIPAANHCEHAAVARAVLAKMSTDAEFDFRVSVDAVGGNLWIAHRKSTPENRGLALLKASTQVITAADVPNWRDHNDVVSKRRSRVRVSGVAESDQDPFDTLTSSRTCTPLDEAHKKHLELLAKSGYTTIWVPDHHLLQTHTAALEWLMEKINIIGFFKTNSPGKDKGSPNCFLFPMTNGAWKVFRFSMGIQEAETWEQDGQGWTTCYFNRAPSLHVAARAMGGKEDEGGKYIFDTAKPAVQSAEALGVKLRLPAYVETREAHLKSTKDGRLLVSIKKSKEDKDPGMSEAGWLEKKDFWTQIFRTSTDLSAKDFSLTDFDEIFRALSTPEGKRWAWALRQKCLTWDFVPKDDVKSGLLGLDYTRTEAEAIIGREGTLASWQVVNLPFQPEYPGNRQWNLGAPQYRYQAAELDDDEAPHHPHWNLILRHVGRDLDSPIAALKWAQDCGIRNGADYLRAWIACMLREPFQPLPYLFLYGEKQNSGKSMLYESIELLMTRGADSAKYALTNQSGFNGELANLVLASIEETDISKSPGAYNRLKDWVTNPVLTIRRMRTDAYSQANTLHFIHTSNDPAECPIMDGDTRITAAYVHPLAPGEEIPKPILKDRLRDEAPHFMRTLMDMQLPPIMGRLRLPVIESVSKRVVQDMNKSPLEVFIEEECFEVTGEMVLFSEFHDRFFQWLAKSGESIGFYKSEKGYGSNQRLARLLPRRMPYGKFGGAITECCGWVS
jgi:hypothetical protein